MTDLASRDILTGYAAADWDIAQFLYHECELLDERLYSDWLELLTDDVVYWVPNADEAGARDDRGVIVYEKLPSLKARVARTVDVRSPTQLPPPRTRHFLSNIVVVRGEGVTVDVKANLLLFVSKENEVFHYPTKVSYRLRASGEGWLIVEKTNYIMTNDLPIRSLPLF